MNASGYSSTTAFACALFVMSLTGCAAIQPLQIQDVNAWLRSTFFPEVSVYMGDKDDPDKRGFPIVDEMFLDEYGIEEYKRRRSAANAAATLKHVHIQAQLAQLLEEAPSESLADEGEDKFLIGELNLILSISFYPEIFVLMDNPLFGMSADEWFHAVPDDAERQYYLRNLLEGAMLCDRPAELLAAMSERVRNLYLAVFGKHWGPDSVDVLAPRIELRVKRLVVDCW